MNKTLRTENNTKTLQKMSMVTCGTTEPQNLYPDSAAMIKFKNHWHKH